MTQATTTEAFIHGTNSGQFDGLKEKCIAHLRQHGELTANEIAFAIGTRRDSISAILRRASYEGLVKNGATTTCSFSGRKCITWMIGSGIKSRKPKKFDDATIVLMANGFVEAAEFLTQHWSNK